MGVGGARELRLLIFYSRLPRLGGKNRGELPHERKGAPMAFSSRVSQQNKSRLCNPIAMPRRGPTKERVV